MKVSLIIERGSSRGRQIQLKRQTTVLGKSEQCDVRIVSRIASRRHCEISMEKDFVVLRDLNSRNGTFLNDTRITGQAFLNDGDRIIVGDAVFSVRISEDERMSTHEEILNLAGDEQPAAGRKPSPRPEPAKDAPPAMVEEVIAADGKPTQGGPDAGLYEQVIEGLVAAGESFSAHYTRTSRKVRNLMDLLTRVLGTGEEERRIMKLAAMLYEVGKYHLATDVLNKTDSLTGEEKEKLKTHPQMALKLFEKAPLPKGASEAIAHHHERYDGAGYPAGLKGEEIPAGARMLAIADALAAMTSSRPYRPALGTPQALDELEKNAGTQFDPAMVSRFVDYCRLHQNELREAVNVT